MTGRWTAPETGWYQLTTDQEPEYLGTERPETEHDDEWPVFLLGPRGLTDLEGPSPFTEGPDRITVTYMRFEQGAVTMNSGTTLPPAQEPSITISWNG